MDTNNKISETSQAGRDRGADEQGAVTEDPFRITAALLHDWNACSDGIAKFQEHFPEGGSYAEVLDKAYEEKQASYAIWLACAAWDAWIEKPDFVKVETSSGDALVARMTAKIDENVGYASRLAASGDASTLAASGYASRLAASGDASTLAASGYDSRLAASGDASRLAASGYDSRLAASGYASTLAASGYDSRLAASGDASTLAASGDASTLAASGDASTLAASGYDSVVAAAGIGATVSLGANGCAAVAYYDGKRFRFALAYVGENVEAGKRYRVNSSGQFEEVV